MVQKKCEFDSWGTYTEKFGSARFGSVKKNKKREKRGSKVGAKRGRGAVDGKDNIRRFLGRGRGKVQASGFRSDLTTDKTILSISATY
jgi:hypothetical protein